MSFLKQLGRLLLKSSRVSLLIAGTPGGTAAPGEAATGISLADSKSFSSAHYSTTKNIREESLFQGFGQKETSGKCRMSNDSAYKNIS